MARLRIYTVHEKADSSAPPVLVREGFSWTAALFTFLWALFHGMWRHALALFFLGMAIGYLIEWLGAAPAFEWAVTGGYLALIGFQAGDWRRGELARKGYVMRDVVLETSRDLAAFRYFQSRDEEALRV